ncbi:MAG TPA: SLC13 family permease [Anaerolineae bacterium]|nr:SLC13 family permease [Anaerolineae bacterium]
MTEQIMLLLLILGIALLLFSFERIPADVVALGVLMSLILTGLLPADAAFAGFGSDTVMMILGLLILTAALVRTGVVEICGRAILRHTGQDPNRLLVVVMVASATMGAFMSNTASTAFFVPLVFGLAQRARTSASKLLMPLAFSSILSSSVTLVSTSTNIVVSGLMTQYELPPMGMFELAPVGVPIAIVGLIYMFFVGRRLIPDRTPSGESAEEFGTSVYLTEIMILPGSSLIGKTLVESGLGRDLDLTVLQVVRGKDRYLAPRANTRLGEGDVLLVEGWRDEILKIKNISGIDIKADVKLSDPELQTEDVRLVEVIILPRSPLIGRTLKSFRFRERYGLQVLAVNRHGETMRRKISQIPLRMGDLLLIQGHRANIALLEEGNTFRILGAVEDKRPNLRRAPLAVAIFVGALIAATFNWLSLPVAVLLGALAAFLTRCITPEEAYREVEWKAIILIGSMLALGSAMQVTGAAEFFAAQITAFAGSANPAWLLTAFFALTVLLTQPMSNQAAAVVIVPVAIQTALGLNLNPRTFAMMIAVAASCSYLTPLEPSCLMVYGPGRYRFMDFLKVGSLLTVLIYFIAILLVPLVWPVS